jgi:hypothetical protein
MMSEHHLRLVKLKNSDLCCVNYYEDLPLRERQQSRAGRRYNRIRRRLPQPITTSQAEDGRRARAAARCTAGART